jgi:5'-3' exonuclease
MNRRPPRVGEKKEKKVNILLVDGNALFKRSVLGAKNLYNIHGQHIGGVYQFITVLRKLIDNDLYHKVFVFWDGKLSGKLRYNIYKDYKSNRNKDYINGTHPVDEDELIQKIQIKKYLEELFIRQYEDEIVESDDLIAYICNHKKENELLTICTSDRDMCQLIDDGIRIYMIDLKTYITKDNYTEYFGHHLSNAALIKILCGDKSDMIKGVKRLGEDTLLEHFPEIKERKVTIDEIINKAKVINNDRVTKKLKPLQVLTNISLGVTDGIQGNKLYEINDLLVNLKKPLITDNVISDLENLKELDLDPTDRSIKNVYQLMKEDGIYNEVKHYSEDYLLPFKKLVDREKNNKILN